ncbi:hypothetical protein E4630_14015 [Aeromonas hydrophila]|uniref:hypothetical protein n=1 Tax=Aeromonas hydrophila TaxID=644 RepID=UPI00107E9F1C|nr:hypothetical protein [Aeromonas hydrophila]QBX71871.1 hypothetical protein E4625_14235 [Aeromonas hydrophila]QBX76570.1 hypothetical protein E4630_14015 [Aeromonas hydrophila]
MKSLIEINHEGQFHEYLTVIGKDVVNARDIRLPWVLEQEGEIIAKISLSNEGERRYFIKAHLLCKVN